MRVHTYPTIHRRATVLIAKFNSARRKGSIFFLLPCCRRTGCPSVNTGSVGAQKYSSQISWENRIAPGSVVPVTSSNAWIGYPGRFVQDVSGRVDRSQRGVVGELVL
jgi:hypothetical protein